MSAKLYDSIRNVKSLCEVRMRLDRPLFYYDLDSGHRTSAIVTAADLQHTITCATEHSVYALTERMINGYISCAGGIRIGIAGEAVLKGEGLHNVKNITSLVIRLPHQVKGCSTFIKVSSTMSENILVISPPGCGKTTLLRDLARRMGDVGVNVAILDERYELSGGYGGKFSLDFGECSDVLLGMPKNIAYPNAIRSLNPDYIVTDELSGIKDVESVINASSSGVSVLASLHGNNAERALSGIYKPLKEVFKRLIVLSDKPRIGTVVEDIN